MRALLLIFDGLVCGPGPNSHSGDLLAPAHLGGIFAAQPQLALPAFFALGLWKLLTADVLDPRSRNTVASFGRIRRQSTEKAPPATYWEMAGVVLDRPFARLDPIPAGLIAAIEAEARNTFLFSSGVGPADVLEHFGRDHLATRKPILACLGGSLVIAAHEQVIAPRRLFEICRIARRHADAWRVKSVAGCPFEGQPGSFRFTAGRADFGLVPPWTVLNAIAQTGLPVEGVGEIHGYFAGSGITRSIPAISVTERRAAIEQLWHDSADGLTIASLADFRHSHDQPLAIDGFARALLESDAWLSRLLANCEEDDLVIIAGTPGDDIEESSPTAGECPLMVLHAGLSLPLGTRQTFADIAASLATFFRLRHPWPIGRSFLRFRV